MILALVGVILFLVNVILITLIAYKNIDRLYISKSISKERDFVIYNDLFSWAMFLILIGAANVMHIISTFLILEPVFSDLLLKIQRLFISWAFVNKIVHLDKIMEKITYERHAYASMIPSVILLLTIMLSPTHVFMLIFIVISVLLFPILFFVASGKTKMNSSIVSAGAVFVALGSIFNPVGLIEFAGITGTLDFMIYLTNITAPISLVIGTLLIFVSFRKNL